MQADLDHLIELQQVDLRLLELTHQIRVFPRLRSETEQKLENARQAVQVSRDAKTENAKLRKKLELDVQQFSEKLDKFRGQLFEVKTNDAYRALQDEIAYLEKQKTEAEDRELEVMVGGDEQEEKIREVEAALKQAEQSVTAELSRLDAEQKAREDEAAKLKAEQEAVRGKITADSLETYDLLARGLNHRPLAEVRDEVCQACRTTIRPQVYGELRRREAIHKCEACHRILYYVKEPPTVDVEKEMAKDQSA